VAFNPFFGLEGDGQSTFFQEFHVQTFLRPLVCVSCALTMPMALAQTAAGSTASLVQLLPTAPLPASMPLNFQSVMTDYRPYEGRKFASR